MAMTVLPKPEHPITAVAFEAMHFQRGIHYLPVRCMEFLIPIQENPKKCGESDWSILPKAWWEVISYVNDNYGKLKACPMDLTLEMRVISESEMLLAPEHGNHYGTCSIEVLGTKLPSVESWEEFKNVIAEKWASYTDNQGKPLNVRPHWGKEFPKKIGNKDSIDFIRDAYRQSFKIFKLRMKEVSEKQGFSIEDMRKLFSNRYLDDLFGPLWEEE